jgi:hypothetical protein
MLFCNTDMKKHPNSSGMYAKKPHFVQTISCLPPKGAMLIEEIYLYSLLILLSTLSHSSDIPLT